MGFFDGFLDPTKNQENAIGDARNGFNTATQGTQNFYNSQLNSATNGQNAYDNALGLNGAGAQQSFQNAFMTGPGYQANMDAGTAAIDQSAVASGMAGSGNTLKSLQKYGSDLYSQEYNGFLDRLSGSGNRGFSAGQGLTGLAQQNADFTLEGGRVKDQGNATKLGNVMSLVGFGAGRLGF